VARRDEEKAAQHPLWGERRQELVFIGIDMNEPRIGHGSMRASLPVMIFRLLDWATLQDSFPAWESQQLVE